MENVKNDQFDIYEVIDENPSMTIELRLYHKWLCKQYRCLKDDRIDEDIYNYLNR